jgi:hypothetical protein
LILLVLLALAGPLPPAAATQSAVSIWHSALPVKRVFS